jgi:CheY-like chemotaxis protein
MVATANRKRRVLPKQKSADRIDARADMRPIEILLVEDNAGDARLTLEAFKEGRVINNFSVVRDGAEALEYLRREGQYADSKTPDLILLDLNLPKKDGREVLADIKADDRLKAIPVVVLTTSSANDDIERAYCHHANCYITKPVDLDQFLRVVQSIETFWLSLVRLPSR